MSYLVRANHVSTLYEHSLNSTTWGGSKNAKFKHFVVSQQFVCELTILYLAKSVRDISSDTYFFVFFAEHQRAGKDILPLVSFHIISLGTLILVTRKCGVSVIIAADSWWC